MNSPRDSDLQAAVAEIFRTELKDPSIELRLDMETGALEGWDSFANVAILMACEERWNLQFTPSEIDGIRCVGDLVAAVRRKLA